MLQLVVIHRQAILRRCQEKAATRTALRHAGEWIDRGAPAFLEHLENALRTGLIRGAGSASAAVRQGQDVLQQGFSISEAVHRYADVRQAITELAADVNTPMCTDDVRILNLCVDDAIAAAVMEFSRAQNQSTLDEEKARVREREGFLAHEMRNLLDSAIMAFELLKTGKMPVGGSTGGVLQRSLAGARTLTNRSLAEVRLTQGAQNRQRFDATAFIEELVPAATLEASARGIGLRVTPGDDGVVIEADRQVLAAVMMNLLQNAFKFTRANTMVVLRVRATTDRVLVDIEDECGGIAHGSMDDLFRPFEQRGADRTGLGLGLAFSRRAVEANNGRIDAHNLPGKGCVFTVSLPRIPIAAAAKM